MWGVRSLPPQTKNPTYGPGVPFIRGSSRINQDATKTRTAQVPVPELDASYFSRV